MKILFVSHLSNKISAGPNWSVPASVDALSKIDEVLWINLTPVEMSHWLKVNGYHNIKEYGNLKLDSLPCPFNCPDFVVFEGVYFLEYVRFSKQLINKNIPYVIVPRGSLTKQATHNHARMKKWIAHKLFFKSFINHASQIQFLTLNEASDSSCNHETNFFVVPNGFNIPPVQKVGFSKNGLIMSFIGRLDMYHKGLDLLIDAIVSNKELLKNNRFSLRIYGPHLYDYNKILDFIRENHVEDIVCLKGEISGEQKTTALLESDVFVMTSRFEGHPMGLIEALAYGLPCLITPGTNMSGEVIKLDAGWVVEENSDAVGSGLVRLLKEKELLKIKGENAIKLANNYNWSTISSLFHSELEKSIMSL